MNERVNAHQARFEADPIGRKAAENWLEQEGYRDLALVKSQRRHHVFVGKNESGEQRFLKAALDPSEQIFLENEVRADDLLRPLTSGLNLRIPEGTFRAEHGGAVADFEFVKGEAYATESALVHPYSDEELEVLFQFQLRKQSLREEDLPEFFQKRGATEFSDASMANKFEHIYLAPAIGPVLTEDEGERLKRIYTSTGFKRGFAHHDFVPWNMLKDSEGNIVLTDPEHARWGMKWYDLAYHYLQTRILLDAPDEAKRAMDFFVTRFKQELPEERIEEELRHPLAYWTAACAFMATHNPKLKERVRAYLPEIL